ncbi:hypothetical protein N9W60_01025 [Flavobacteriaceae bacterium]|nr:hypothetical protein [Flavobacteriaceae bacterium]
MKIKLLLLLISPFCNAQVGIYGDIYISNNEFLAIHTPATHFIDGIVLTDPFQPGALKFMKDNHPVDAHFGSHAQADVISIETPEFIFPVGDQGIYQPLKISEGNSEDLTVSFKHSMHSFNNTSISIDKMSTRFHWVAEGSKEARLTLSRNAFSELDVLTEELAALVMLGYTGSVWEVIPATLSPFPLSGDVLTSLTEGAISSTERIDFSLYEAFTLGSILLDTSTNSIFSKFGF